MSRIDEKVAQSLKDSDIRARPNASPGLWLCPLVPTAIILSAVKHPYESLAIYKMSAVLSIGLLLTPLAFILQCSRRKNINNTKSLLLIPGSLTATLYYMYFGRGFIFSFFGGLLSGIGYYKLFLFTLKSCPLSFTVGEATIVAQSIVLFTFSSILNIFETIGTTPTKVLDVSTIIIQIGLLTIGLICAMTYSFTSLRKAVPFYMMSCLLLTVFLIIPLHYFLKMSPILWLLQLLTKDVDTMKFMAYCSGLSILAIVAIKKQIIDAKKASTSVRKCFHILAVAVYLPGLLYHCSILYVSSGVILGIFIAIELLRILNIPPLGQGLQDGFMVFCDEKDAGTIALTPIYLLAGCSMPLWLHPAPCDLTDSVGHYLVPLISGLLSVGVGDTAASTVGSLLGRHRWPGSKKTVEGTLACVFAQALMVSILVYLGFIVRGHLQILKSGIAIIVISLVEARTSQVDNLVLPLLMYIILIL